MSSLPASLAPSPSLFGTSHRAVQHGQASADSFNEEIADNPLELLVSTVSTWIRSSLSECIAVAKLPK